MNNMIAAKPKISIVMPVLNRADTIEKALLSVINQHYPHLELIIIDGGSSDGTVDIFCRYAEHISYWQSEPDGNPTNAMNIGVAKATGDIIGILMADDWYEDDLFAKLADAYRLNPAADMFTCGGRIVSWDQQKQQYVTQLAYSSAQQMALTLNNICFNDVSVICCRFITAKLYQQLGLYLPFDKHGNYVFSNDKEFLIRAALQQINNIHLNYVGHNYLAHAGSSTFGNNHANIVRMCREHMLIAEKFLAQSDLTKKQRMQLIYWYNDQASRLLVYNALDGKFKPMWQVMQEALCKYNILLPASFVLTSLRLARKKIRCHLAK